MADTAPRWPPAHRAARRPRALRGAVPSSTFRHGPSHRGGPADPGSDAGRRPDRGSVSAARREKPAVEHGNRAGMAPAPAEALRARSRGSAVACAGTRRLRPWKPRAQRGATRRMSPRSRPPAYPVTRPGPRSPLPG